MNIVFFFSFIYLQCNFSVSELTNENESPQEIIYKIESTSNGDEYIEGDYFVYDLKANESYILYEDIMLEHSEAWKTNDNKYVLITLSNLYLSNSSREIIHEYQFNSDELIIGAVYDIYTNRILFLLNDLSDGSIDLCEFKIDQLELKRILPEIDLSKQTIEAPFRKMLLFPNSTLYIENQCLEFLKVDLENKLTDKEKLDKGYCFGNHLIQNRNKIIYCSYDDLSKTEYAIKEYNIDSKKNKLLLEGENEYDKSVKINLFSERNETQFLIEIDGKLYFYSYNKFEKLPFDSGTLLAYADGILIYTREKGKVEYYSIQYN